MKSSKNLVELIKTFEGFSAKMYLDIAGLPTIGIGTLIDTKEEEYLKTAIITEAQAMELVFKDLAPTEKFINNVIKSNINQNQFDAIVDFCYNCGVGNFRSSTLLKKINANPNDPTIKDEFLKWNKAAGKVLRGLTRRRQAEVDLYFKSV